MAISNELRTKLNKQTSIFNELQRINGSIQKALQFAQHETAQDNPHAATKDEAAFVKVHTATVSGLVDELAAKFEEVKTALTA